MAEVWLVRARSIEELLRELIAKARKGNEFCEGGDEFKCRRFWNDVVRSLLKVSRDWRLFEGPRLRDVGVDLTEILELWEYYGQGMITFDEFRDRSFEVLVRAHKKILNSLKEVSNSSY